ncbi:MAG: hypothetical protein ACC655_01830, partial [Rhodothermia bacterium]
MKPVGRKWSRLRSREPEDAEIVEEFVEPESKQTRRGRRAKDLATLIQTTINDNLSNDFVATRRVTRDEAKIIASLTGKNTNGW